MGSNGEEVKPDFVLGVDPGLSDALCLMRISDRQIDIFDMPVTDGRVDPAKLAGMVEMCKLRSSIVAAVENVSSMPRQAGAFNFGRSAGVVHGVLGALGTAPNSRGLSADWSQMWHRRNAKCEIIQASQGRPSSNAKA